jgi:hypothetical protein
LQNAVSTHLRKHAVHDASLERWFFYQDTAGLWKWARLDIVGTILGHSGVAFDTREECLEHARRSGYREPDLARRMELVQDRSALVEVRVTPI